MKQFVCFFICICLATFPYITVAQENIDDSFEYNDLGIIKSARFSSSGNRYKGIKSAEVFFRDVLKIKANNSFVRNEKVRLEKEDETFEQFYKGLRVDNAGYTFHYDEKGLMRYAHGNYVEITDLDINPKIKCDDAAKAFAEYKGIHPDSITHSAAELIIKCFNDVHSNETPMLVYKVAIEVSNYCVTEYGFVDAKTGKLLSSEAYTDSYGALGTFVTKYYGTKYATTDYNGSFYRLYDSTRGNGIEVKDLQNYDMDSANYASHAHDFYHLNNNWHYALMPDSSFMALDVFWALEKIYDRLYNVHGKNSWDNNGKKIMAYVRAAKYSDGVRYTDNAYWNNYREELYFGEGHGWNKPVSAPDIVAHEFGHGITYYQIGWPNSQQYLKEGLSDIWGAIMDFRYGDINSDVWKIGEHLIPSKTCLRDFASPESNSASTQAASTYGSDLYNSGDYYVKSGVFSHWFYLLVNGGQGNNANGFYYSLQPVSMDVAENLIVKAVYGGYLRYTTTYSDVRNAFIEAARAMNVSGLVDAVCNAWYAVGVGGMSLSISGPHLTSSQSTYSVEGLPSGFYVTWSLSDSYYDQNCLQLFIPPTYQCRITRAQGYDMLNATLTATVKYNGQLVQTLTKTGLYAYSDFRGHYTSGDLIGDINYTHYFHIKPNVTTYITSQNLIGATTSYNNSGTTPSYWGFSSTEGRIVLVAPSNNSNTPIFISVDDVCGNHYQLYAMISNASHLITSYSNNMITATIKEKNDSKSASQITSWKLEIINATTGRLMANLSSNDSSALVQTSGWSKGIYIIKATVGDDVLTDKVMVK